MSTQLPSPSLQKSQQPGSLWTPEKGVAPYHGVHALWSPRAVKHRITIRDDCFNQAAFGHEPRQRVIPYFLYFCFDRPDRRSVKALCVCKSALCKDEAKHALALLSEPRSGIFHEIELTGRCVAPDCLNTAYFYGLYVEPSSRHSQEILGGELCLAHDIEASSDKTKAAAFERSQHSY